MCKFFRPNLLGVRAVSSRLSLERPSAATKSRFPWLRAKKLAAVLPHVPVDESAWGYLPARLAAGNGPYDEKGFGPGRDRVGQRAVWRLMGQILLAGEEPQEGPALLCNVVADRPTQHRVAGLERVEDRALRNLAVDVELHLAIDARQRSQMHREHDSDHDSVWTSTDNTGGRSRT